MPPHTFTEWHSGRVDQPAVLPGFIPFRALTNRTYLNLLVAGKTMAQSFVVNSALLPWSRDCGGRGCRVHGQRGTQQRPGLRTVARPAGEAPRVHPIEWTIGGATLPAKGEPTSF